MRSHKEKRVQTTTVLEIADTMFCTEMFMHCRWSPRSKYWCEYTKISYNIIAMEKLKHSLFSLFPEKLVNIFPNFMSHEQLR